MNRIRWTKPAVDDLTRVCDYSRERFGTTRAQQTADVVVSCVAGLQRFPFSGRAGRKPGTREIAIPSTPLVVIYRLKSAR